MKALTRNQCGAIMLLGLFMAVFLTGLLYHVVGLGEAVLHRERMQDAADAAAFSAAVVHARGMNVIALINMVMAALLAVLVTLKLVETLISIAIIAISLASFLQPGLAAAIPDLVQLRQQTKQVHDQLREPIHRSLEALHVAARGVRVVVPAASELAVMSLVVEDYAPPARSAVAVLPRATLPTRNGTFAQLCVESGGYVGDLVSVPFKPLPLGDAVGEIVADATTELVSGGSDWFCGPSGGKPPETTVKHEAVYPKLPSRVLCESFDPTRSDYQGGEAEHARACTKAEQEEAAAKWDDATGNCLSHYDCRPTGFYELSAALARQACEPRKKHDRRLRGFHWQEQRVSREYTFEDGRWKVTSEQRATPTREHGRRRPCGESWSPISPTWNPDSRGPDGKLMPVCDNAARPAAPGREGARITLEHVEVLRVLRCQETYKRTYKLAEEHQSDRIDGGSEDRKVPQVLLPNVALGEDPLQLRAVVLGDLPKAGPEGVIKVAAWHKDDKQALSLTAAKRALGQLALAQAEYFYDVPDLNADPQSFVWNMRWKARLRRFRAPQSEPDTTSAEEDRSIFGEPALLQSLEGACQSLVTVLKEGGAACAVLDPEWQDILAH